jgi:hypothetical protein
MILDYFKWNLNIPTASLFCELWRSFCLDRSDIMAGQPIEDFELVEEKFAEFVNYYLEIYLQVIVINQGATTLYITTFSMMGGV